MKATVTQKTLRTKNSTEQFERVQLQLRDFYRWLLHQHTEIVLILPMTCIIGKQKLSDVRTSERATFINDNIV